MKELVWAFTITCAYVVGAFIGAFGGGNDIPRIVEILLAAILAGLGTLLGARFAFDIQARSRAEAQVEKRVAAANLALFIMSRQFNLMSNIQLHELNTHRNNPQRHIEMLPNYPIEADSWRLSLESLDFLVGPEHGGILMEMLLADDWFKETIAAVNLRYHIHHELIQPKLEAVMIAGGGDFLTTALENIVGRKLVIELTTATDQLYNFVDKGCETHAALGKRLAVELHKIFPQHKFMVFRLADEFAAAEKAGREAGR